MDQQLDSFAPRGHGAYWTGGWVGPRGVVDTDDEEFTGIPVPGEKPGRIENMIHIGVML
jgi:hypothetical protein